ncbi:MAG TPA: deoxyribonuclease V [Fimbriiglobus sp.]|jgi:deoxyribonuclease V
MTFATLHRWDVTPVQAVELQRKLASQVDVSRPLGRLRTVAGCDISYNMRSPILFAAVVVVRVPDLEVVELVAVKKEVSFPYVPGLLSFREAPPLLAAFGKLKTKPDAVMLDGQGLAHPRRFGLACHLGLWLDLPTVGCAKSRLVGEFVEPGIEAGDTSPLMDRGEKVGVMFRSRRKVKPVFISPGHRIDMAGAVEVVRRTLSGYRMPAPTRLAHIAANAARTAES